MKKIFTTLLILFLTIGFAFAQAEQTIIKSISIENTSGIILELPGEVKASEWDKDFVRVTVIIDAVNTSEDILKRLITVGRYDIKSKVVGDELHITMPKVAQIVTIKGTDLEDRLHFEISYPKNSVLRYLVPSFYVPTQSL